MDCAVPPENFGIDDGIKYSLDGTEVLFWGDARELMAMQFHMDGDSGGIPLEISVSYPTSELEKQLRFMLLLVYNYFLYYHLFCR